MSRTVAIRSIGLPNCRLPHPERMGEPLSVPSVSRRKRYGARQEVDEPFYLQTTVSAMAPWRVSVGLIKSNPIFVYFDPELAVPLRHTSARHGSAQISRKCSVASRQ